MNSNTVGSMISVLSAILLMGCNGQAESEKELSALKMPCETLSQETAIMKSQIANLDKELLVARSTKEQFVQDSIALKARIEQLEKNALSSNVVFLRGGSADNRHDICWVLFKDGKTEVTKDLAIDRYVLCCYQVENGARSFELVDIREISFDMKEEELNPSRFSPSRLKKEYLKRLEKHK